MKAIVCLASVELGSGLLRRLPGILGEEEHLLHLILRDLVTHSRGGSKDLGSCSLS